MKPQKAMAIETTYSRFFENKTYKIKPNENKYYFIKKSSHSYRLEELFNSTISRLTNEFQKNPNPIRISLPLLSPLNIRYNSIAIDFSKLQTQEQLQELLIKKITETAILDNSRTTYSLFFENKTYKIPPNENKYYFIINDSRSYRLEELFNSTISRLDNKLQKLPELICISSHLLSPLKNRYNSIVIDFSKLETQKQLQELLIKKITETTILDISRTAGETECSISIDSFVNPRIVNLTGRSYSYKSINDMMQYCLKNHCSLELEEKSIPLSEIPLIKLYPNESLVKEK